MTTIKSYTDLNQSRKLAEILPLESADMIWANDNDVIVVPYDMATRENVLHDFIPCWSLAALLDIYPMVVGRDMDMYCCWQNHKNLHSKHYNNPVDACFEMVIKLHELNLL